MKRLLALAAAVVAAAAFLVTSASGADNDQAKGCIDIVSGSLFFGADGVVSASVTMRDPACRAGAKYTLFVLEESLSTDLLATDRGRISGVNPNAVGFETRSLTTVDNDVCVYVEARHREDVDRAPDTGCLELLQGVSPGGGGFN